MILCLDIGNTQIHGGIFKHHNLEFSFRYPTQVSTTADQFGIFLTSIMGEKAIDCNAIQQIAMSSVVPSMNYAIQAACIKYLAVKPFILNANAKTALIINYANPLEIGADLIASAIAVNEQFPNQDKIVIGMGTATTLCAISASQEFLGGAILAGMRLSMQALATGTAQLSAVEIKQPRFAYSHFTPECIQAGLYFGHLGAIKEITQQITQQVFANNQPLLIGTGGFADLFKQESLFDVILPDLVLQGLRLALNHNNNRSFNELSLLENTKE